METVWYGLQVAVVGMLVVFVGLIVLIACVSGLKLLLGGAKTAQPTAQAQPVLPMSQPMAQALPMAQAQPAVPRNFASAETLTNDSLLAVLAAAVSAVLMDEGKDPDGAFAIKSVHKI